MFKITQNRRKHERRLRLRLQKDRREAERRMVEEESLYCACCKNLYMLPRERILTPDERFNRFIGKLACPECSARQSTQSEPL